MIDPKEEKLIVNLRDPAFAALLAWLLPGLGHFYQRRWAKGVLFMICILSIYFSGMLIGRGRVVYASFRTIDSGGAIEGDLRLAYLCQVHVGLPALPAVVQALRAGGDHPKTPLWPFEDDPGSGWMAPPRLLKQRVPVNSAPEKDVEPIPGDDRYVKYMPRPFPRREQVQNNEIDGAENELSRWHREMGGDFEMGTVYTMIAGLLNLLVVFDAWGGPVLGPPRKKKGEDSKTVNKPGFAKA